MKRRLYVGISVVMAAMMAAGCGMTSGSSSTGSADASSDSGSAETAASGEGATTISLMLNGSTADQQIPGYEKLIEEFNASNEYGVTVTYELVANADYKTKLTTLMASDSEPDIIFTWELGYLENFVNGNKIVDLQPYLDADEEWANSFNGGTLEQLTYNGDVYGIPTQSSMCLMFYNTAIFDEYGLSVPTTYDEFVEVCETLKSNDVTPIALASTAEDAWLVSQYIQQLSNGIAGDALYESLKDGTGKWNDDAFVQAGELFQAEVNAGYYEDGFTGVSGDEARQLFMDGKTAMYFNGSWEISNVGADTSSIKDNVSCFVMPAVDSQYSNISVGSVDTSFAITKNCGNVEAAVAFLKYWTNADNAGMLLYDYGRTPSTSFDLDESKISALNLAGLECINSQTAMTPWFDRMDTDMGNEFNNESVAISNGDAPQEAFDALQNYYETK